MKLVILTGLLLILTTIAYKPTSTAFKQRTHKGYVLSWRLGLGEPVPIRYESYESLGIEFPKPLKYGYADPYYWNH